VVSARDMARYPMIGIEPTDPYGRIMCEMFESENVPFDLIIKARFGTTVCAPCQGRSRHRHHR
jgi:hypothetical protein